MKENLLVFFKLLRCFLPVFFCGILLCILLCVFAVNGIAFANIYEVPKNENPQPAMGKLVGEIMIDFAFIRKYPIVNYNGYSSKA